MTQDKRRHVDYQRRYFDQHCDVFRQAIPEEVEERTRLIVESAALSSESRVVDVGTGMGVLVKFFLQAGVSPNNIIGVDLSDRMLEEARKRYPDVNFVQADFAEFAGDPAGYDAVFFNACFGNIFDQDKAIIVATHLLAAGGRIVISHPLGNEFVQQLKDSDPHLVLTLMPDRKKLEQWCHRFPLSLQTYRDEPQFYLAILQKNPPMPRDQDKRNIN
jgi:ubiquinone/menaquinone biosynthesis C-methylase UbiE